MTRKLKRGRGPRLYDEAKRIIPGGTQLLSKRPEMFLPDYWPAYFSRAKGAHIWDLEGRKYLDMSYSGIGSCVLGYADATVDKAVLRVIRDGNMSTLNAPEEVEVAELLCKLHPWAKNVRFARTGGEAMAIAVRIARASTGKDVVAFCGYHGWHDWYLAANLGQRKALDGHLLPGLAPAGVPRALRGTALPFAYNQTDELEHIVASQGKKLAAIVLEPIRNDPPSRVFLAAIHRSAKSLGIPIIVDEITAGFRIAPGGAHLASGLRPDIAVFAKGMSNGYPMAAVIGKADVMSAAQNSFISSTYWTDRIGPVAARETIEKFVRLKVHERLQRLGRAVKRIWQEAAARHHVPIHVGGIDPLAHFSFETKEPLVAQTLFTKHCLENEILGTKAFYATYAHRAEHLSEYEQVVDSSFRRLGKWMAEGSISRHLTTKTAMTGFKRLI